MPGARLDGAPTVRPGRVRLRAAAHQGAATRPRAGAGLLRRWLLAALAMATGPLGPRRAAADVAAGPMEPRTMAYGPGPEQQLDFFRPAGGARVPLVIYVHGGGWDRGSRRSVRPALRALLGQGFAVASLDYPLGPAAPLEEQVRAVSHGIAWLVAHAAELGIDPGRMALVGFSAGANVGTLAVLRRDLAPGGAGAEAPRLRLVVGLDGVGYDVVGIMTARPNHPRLIPVFGRDPARWARLSPVVLLRTAPPGSVPPFLLANGQAIFALDAEQFEAALKASGLPVERHVIPGLAHGEFMRSLTDPGSPLSGILRRALASV
jgi:arylformamidase